MLRPDFEAGLNEASTRPQLCRTVLLGTVEAWFEAGLNKASKRLQNVQMFSTNALTGAVEAWFEAGFKKWRQTGPSD